MKARRILSEALFWLAALGPSFGFAMLVCSFVWLWDRGNVFSTSMVPRETIIGWSVGIGQIAFALLAAALALSVPHHNNGLRRLRYWETRAAHFLNFSVNASTLSRVANDLVNGPAARVINRQNSKSSIWKTVAAGQTDSVSILDLAKDLPDAILAVEGWDGQEHETQLIPKDESHLKALLITVHNCLVLRDNLGRLQKYAAALILLNSFVGATAIGLDPFWWVTIQSHIFRGRYPLPDDYRYPELPLWLLGSLYLYLFGLLLFLTLRAGSSCDAYAPEES